MDGRLRGSPRGHRDRVITVVGSTSQPTTVASARSRWDSCGGGASVVMVMAKALAMGHERALFSGEPLLVS
ncbi:MAG: hypothetical protein ACFB12_17215 [Leptolyngbyaceae cyanobacterium]